LDRFDLEVEKKDDLDLADEALAEAVRTRIKSLVGISPRVKILAEKTLERATHKAKRVVDKREKVWAE